LYQRLGRISLVFTNADFSCWTSLEGSWKMQTDWRSGGKSVFPTRNRVFATSRCVPTLCRSKLRQRPSGSGVEAEAAGKSGALAPPPPLAIAVRYSLSSLSISSIVGSVPFNFSGRAAASWYSEIPIGLETSRSAYSATNRSRVLQRIRPMLG